MRLRDKLKNLFYRKINTNNLYDYEDLKESTVSKKVTDNKGYLQRILEGSTDVIYREFSIGKKKQPLMVVYIDGMVDRSILNDFIMKSLMVDIKSEVYNELFSIEEIESRLLTTSEVKFSKTYDDLVMHLLSGDTLIFAEGSSKALIVGSKGWENRGVDEPTTEQNVRGPKDCFIETLRSNTVQIRRRIRDPNLMIDMVQVGRRSKTDIAIVYIKGIIMDGLIEELMDKINSIDIDAILDSSQLIHLIENGKWTIFPQAVSTERPDKACAAIYEGRFAIIVDGSPYVILAPSTFSMYLDAPDDYYERPLIASVVRLTRYISYFLSASLPGIYVAITNFHPGMLPTNLALAITTTRVALPFPTFIEIFIMESILEVMQEAGLRLPQSIGQTVSIVGGIVIGQSAVQAGLVSPIVTIIAALTAISSFTLPSYSANMTSRILRIPFILAGSTFGFFGIIMFAMVILTHMASLETFGIGYFEDFSPYRMGTLKDTMIKVPISLMNTRSELLKPQDTIRQKPKNTKGDRDEK